MDPQDQRPKRPSLLVGDAEQAKPVESNNRILADIGGQKPPGKPKAKPPRPARPPTGKRARWWVVALVVALLLALGIWRFAPDPEQQASPAPARDALAATAAAPAATEPPAGVGSAPGSASSAVPGNPAVAAEDGGAAPAVSPSGDSAVIVEDPQKPDLASTPPPATAASTAANATSAELGRVFSPAPVAVKPAALQPRVKRDDDVDLLTALMRHLDDDTVASPPLSAGAARHAAKPAGKQLNAAPRSSAAMTGGDPAKAEQRLKHCPAANTEAGVACRQRICAQFQGRTPSCPAPQPSAAAALGQE